MSRDGAVHFVCMDWRHLDDVSAVGRTIYGELLNLCVWNKSNAGMGSLYRSKHELVFVYRVGKAPHFNAVELGRHGRNRTNVWDYASVNSMAGSRREDLALHPTVKPTALVADAIQDVTRRGELVLDIFLGSGTTLIAAERTGRRFRGIDIDPAYVDVAVDRWAAMTGQEPRLAAGDADEQAGRAGNRRSAPGSARARAATRRAGRRPEKPSTGSAFDIVIDKTLTVTQGGVPREVTVEEALQHRTYQDAVAGNRSARREVLKMIEQAARDRADRSRQSGGELVESLRPEHEELAHDEEAPAIPQVLGGLGERAVIGPCARSHRRHSLTAPIEPGWVWPGFTRLGGTALAQGATMKVVAPLLVGATAGALSTVAMSAVMLGAKRAGVTGELPPERITRRVIDAVSAEPPDDQTTDAVAAVAHLGFGAVAGALFGLLTTRTGAARGSPASAAFTGMIYATGIWLVSYQGWVPALGIMPPASSDLRGRAVTMLTAHWVYGAALGVLVTLFRRQR